MKPRLEELTLTDDHKDYFLKKINALNFLSERPGMLTPKVEKELVETFKESVGFIPYLRRKAT